MDVNVNGVCCIEEDIQTVQYITIINYTVYNVRIESRGSFSNSYKPQYSIVGRCGAIFQTGWTCDHYYRSSRRVGAHVVAGSWRKGRS